MKPLDGVPENPIRAARHRLGRTLEQFGEDCGIHIQAVFLNEQGVYPHVLPAVGHRLSLLGFDILVLQGDYSYYQTTKRQVYGSASGLGVSNLPAPVGGNPVVAFRATLDMSRMRFAKSFCIHPSELDQLEHGYKRTLSEQFKRAMLEAGLPATVLEELEYRCSEFVDSKAADSKGPQEIREPVVPISILRNGTA